MNNKNSENIADYRRKKHWIPVSLKSICLTYKKIDPVKCVKFLVMFVIIITIIFVCSQRIFHVQFPFNNIKIRFFFSTMAHHSDHFGKNIPYVKQETVKMLLWKGSPRSSKISLSKKFLKNLNNFFNEYFLSENFYKFCFDSSQWCLLLPSWLPFFCLHNSQKNAI